MQNIDQILKASNLSINELLIQNMDKDLTLKDFLVFLKLLNTSCECFDCSKMAKTLGLTEEDVMTSFNNLIIKGIIEYKPVKENGKIKEVISLDKFYNNVALKLNNQNKLDISNNIYDIFQKELVRSLSPTEYEYINNWLEKGLTEDLIIGALKEAVLSGVKSFRYIDRVLFDWQEKGYRSMNDVEISKKKNTKAPEKINQDNNSNEEYFDYDWLNDDDE
ncbi:dNA replication protein dnaD [Mycoplasma sp. CAG:956]|nr:dNA replication protein dnaD [Mycoplasma sp. CAG:956]